MIKKINSFAVHTFYTQYPDGTITINKAHVDDLTWSFTQVGINISDIRTANEFKEANKKIKHLLYERIQRLNKKMTEYSFEAIECLMKGDSNGRIKAHKKLRQLSEIQKDMIINFDK